MTAKKWFRKRRWWLLAGLVVLVLAIAPPAWTLHSIFRGIRSGAPLHVHPVVALTYDDGPQMPETLELLDVLEKEAVPATFFQIGREIEMYPEVVQKVAAAGHEIGNHSYSHPKMVLRSPAFIESELVRTDQALIDLGIPKPKLMRPPFGSRLLILPWYLWRRKQSLILWAVDPKDFQKGI
ncbi:MAG: polysaccharide deacetylase family protein, partial [Cyanobacteria bacterium P01_H01_bin.130]